MWCKCHPVQNVTEIEKRGVTHGKVRIYKISVKKCFGRTPYESNYYHGTFLYYRGNFLFRLNYRLASSVDAEVGATRKLTTKADRHEVTRDGPSEDILGGPKTIFRQTILF